MTRQTRYHLIELSSVLCLLLLFAFLAFSMLGGGANLYQKVTEDMDENYEVRTPLAYMATKVRQSDVVGGVSWEVVDDRDVLVLKEYVDDGRVYETRIYTYEGYLYELYQSQGDGLTLAEGQKIMELERMEMKKLGEHTFLVTTYSSTGTTASMILSPRSIGGAADE